MKVGFISLGCSKNLVDTEMCIGIFKKENMRVWITMGITLVLSALVTKCFILVREVQVMKKKLQIFIQNFVQRN